MLTDIKQQLNDLYKARNIIFTATCGKNTSLFHINNTLLLNVTKYKLKMTNIEKNLFRIRDQISNKAPQTQLIAVSKYRTEEEINTAIKAGQSVFGENRVQETLSKWPSIKEQHPNIKLHLIGPLQTNKAKDAIKIFDVIEVIDRPKLCQVLITEMKKQNKWPNCLIQINTGLEPQKAGIFPDEADDFIKECIALGLPVKGLMCIPPTNEPAEKHFSILRDIAQRHNLKILSMGMSNDYLKAIENGSTHIRVGTAIFGERNK